MIVRKRFMYFKAERSVFWLDIKFSIGLEYVKDSQTTVLVNGIGFCTDTNIVIPDRLPDGRIVVGVSEKAFFRCDGIESINLPATINTIGAYAFAWCSDLESVIAPGVVFIEERAFMGCKRLCRVSLSKRLESIEDKAFSYCTAMKEIILPDSLFFMGVGTFEGCKNLESATLPRRLREINNSTFNACMNLKRVNIPANLKYVDEYAFAYCMSLENISLPYGVVINSAAFYESGFNPEKFKVS